MSVATAFTLESAADAISLRDRLRCHWWTKIWLGALLIVVFVVSYTWAQRWGVVAPSPPIVTPVDRLIPFQPHWIWVYLTLYPLTGVAWLATRRSQLWRYAAGFVFILAVATTCFFLWPVDAPRPEVLPATPTFRLMIFLDTPLNTLPSLHVAFAFYHARLVERLLQPATRGRALLWTWVALLCFSTLAVKQHNFVDVPTALLLAVLGDQLAWRKAAT